jgi:hypothetical protein
VQCGISSVDFQNPWNAEKIAGGPGKRPCAVAHDSTTPAADHAGTMAAGLAAAATLVLDDAKSHDADKAEAAAWLDSAAKVVAWGVATPGMAKDWFSDVRASCACVLCRLVALAWCRSVQAAGLHALRLAPAARRCCLLHQVMHAVRCCVITNLTKRCGS